ncbi:MAG: DUF3871 family protein [Weeksellaceae bacterium]|nr:DUF3871 family protein [Bacteroidota bacterium]MCG2781910.1 DUF3871 family protein [Weeksellaceae bacterium]
MDAIHNKPKEETSDMELHSVTPKSRRSLRDYFLEEKDEIEEAQIFYPSSMNTEIKPESITESQAFLVDKVVDSFHGLHSQKSTSSNEYNGDLNPKEEPSSPFIVANTLEIPLTHLHQDCIIPVFSKDNERTISHQEFIESVVKSAQRAFPQNSICEPEVRVSHQIKGRTPEAIHMNAKDLLEHHKTLYYERMAFMVRIPSITEEVNRNKLTLCVGGIRSYNQENLYSKKSMEKFKFFIGFQNRVCMNMCISTDGFLENLRVSDVCDLESKALEVMQNYNAELHLMEMKELSQDYLSEHQFAQLIGKSRLYQHLPKLEKLGIPELNFNDSHINTMAKDYYADQNFSRLEDGRINLWNVFNLFTQANKSSYIDTFLDRNLNAFEFSKGLQKTLNGNSDYHWFLS